MVEFLFCEQKSVRTLNNAIASVDEIFFRIDSALRCGLMVHSSPSGFLVVGEEEKGGG